MKILFLGDIVGRPGRETVKKVLPEMIAEHQPDLVIAQAENLTHGKGFIRKHIVEMQEAGVDFFTNGNHAFKQKDGVEALREEEVPMVRPVNFVEEDLPGVGVKVVEARNGEKILVINLIGEVFMNMEVHSPFEAIDKVLEEYKEEEVAGVFVDVHAETTAEKYGLGHYVDGRVSALVGTHTHVQTNDARILEGGTAYITDVGMCGGYDGVIGVSKAPVLQRFLKGEKMPFEPLGVGQMVFSAVLVELDAASRKALNITNIMKIHGRTT